MKKTIYTVALAALMLAGCSQDENLNVGEEVKMTFTAKLPQSIASRAGNDLLANKMVVGIYEETGENNYSKAKMETVDINSNKPTYYVTLIKGKKYKVVFWAYNQAETESSAPYSLNDLEEITIENTTGNLEAFTAFQEVVGGKTNQKEITLQRPVAKVRVGTIDEDWTSAVSLGKTPSSSTIKLTKCPNFYNALTGKASDTSTTELTFSTPSLAETTTFTTKVGQEDKTYIDFGTCYTFASDKATGSTVTCELEVKNKSDNSLENFFSDSYEVTVKPNHRTNIIGRLMTGTTEYTVTISTTDYTDDNEVIE